MKLYVVCESGMCLGRGVRTPVRYYFDKTEAEKDVADGGTDEEWSPYRKLRVVEITDKYIPKTT